MTHLLARRFGSATLAAAGLMAALWAVPAAAQQPTSQQQSALRSNCRSDAQSFCSGMRGQEALQCLIRNVGKLSAGCQGAVRAVMPPAPAAAPAPRPAPPPAAAAQPPASPPPAQTAPTQATPVPPPPAPPPAAATAKPSPAPTAPAKPAAAPVPAKQQPAARPVTPPAAAATPPAPPPPPAVVVVPSSPRERIALSRACHGDTEVHCKNVPAGDGRIVACLMRNEMALSPACRKAMSGLRR